MPSRNPAADKSVLFTIQLALRKALKMVRGLRREITERDEHVMSVVLAREIGLAYDFAEKPIPGHTVEMRDTSERSDK